MAAALACNDFDGVSFTDAEWEILSEVGITLYDAVAFHKHRAEGETNSTFAYADYKMRKECSADAVKSSGAWTLHGHIVLGICASPISYASSGAHPYDDAAVPIC